jgi:hypothetical protein
MSSMSEALHYRNVLAGQYRHRPNDTKAILETRQAMKTAKLAAAIEKILADSPPLHREQIKRLVGLLTAHVAPGE